MKLTIYFCAMTREDLMRKAIELSKENVENGGGPFGAVIATKEGGNSCNRSKSCYGIL